MVDRAPLPYGTAVVVEPAHPYSVRQMDLPFSPGNYVLQYLYSRPKLATFVVQGLVTLFARITKLGWFDSSKETENFVFRNVIADVTKFLQVQKHA